MATDTTVEERVTAVEQELKQVRSEWIVVQQTPLIQARLLNALRETQLEQSRTLDRHSADIAELKTDVAELKTDVAEVKTGVQHLIGMLDPLIEREE